MAYSEPLAPPPVLRPAKRKNTVLIVSVVLLVMLLTGAGCVALFLGGSKAVSGAKVPADQFLSALEKPDYAAARELMSSRAKKETSATIIADVMGISQKRRGEALGHSEPQGFNVKNVNGVTHVQLVYKEAFAGESDIPVTLVLTSENNAWKVESFQFAR